MRRKFFSNIVLSLTLGVMACIAPSASAADESPDGLVKRLTDEVLDTIKAEKLNQSADITKILALVDNKIMPNVDFKRMTASAVGPAWRRTTPEQQERLQNEFKTLLVRTYSSALAQINDQKITVKPMRAAPTDTEVVVRSEIRGRGDPIQLEYRLEKTPGQGAGWKIYNINVLGVWLMETYRGQFAQEINTKGVDGLIATLAARNKANGDSGKKN